MINFLLSSYDVEAQLMLLDRHIDTSAFSQDTNTSSILKHTFHKGNSFMCALRLIVHYPLTRLCEIHTMYWLFHLTLQAYYPSLHVIVFSFNITVLYP
jgi:hypothetical protein